MTQQTHIYKESINEYLLSINSNCMNWVSKYKKYCKHICRLSRSMSSSCKLWNITIVINHTVSKTNWRDQIKEGCNLDQGENAVNQTHTEKAQKQNNGNKSLFNTKRNLSKKEKNSRGRWRDTSRKQVLKWFLPKNIAEKIWRTTSNYAEMSLISKLQINLQKRLSRSMRKGPSGLKIKTLQTASKINCFPFSK